MILDSKARSIFCRDAQKAGTSKKNAGLVFGGVLLGFIGFIWVLLGFIDFGPSNYRVLLGFIGFFLLF